MDESMYILAIIALLIIMITLAICLDKVLTENKKLCSIIVKKDIEIACKKLDDEYYVD